jgi:hypothetical protein
MSMGSGNERGSTRPPSRRTAAATARPGLEQRDRVTIDFSGPPLDLPNLSDSDDALFEQAPDEELTLDMAELRPLGGEASPRLGRGAEEESELGLDLDLSGFDEPASRVLDAADGWMLDRERRSSPPPFEGALPSHATEPPPVDPSRLRGASSSSQPALPSEDPGSISDSTEGDALGLVDRNRPSTRDVDIVSDMAERYALGDFTGALRAAELLLGMVPDHLEALRYARSSRERLEQLYTSRLGSLHRIAEVAVPDHEIRWLGLDHRAGFLLSRVDGGHSIEEILDVSGMPRLEALKTLSELVSAGAVRLVDR